MTIARDSTILQDDSLPPPVFGLVLVGGKSSRMDREKGLVEYGGRTQVNRAHELLMEHTEGVFVSCRPDQGDNPGYRDFPLLFDCQEDLGPIGGILSAFRACPRAAWLVTACDLPYLDRNTVAHLLINRNPDKLATAYISSHDGLPEPLCAIYEPAAEATLLECVKKDIRCPRKALIRSESNVELLVPVNPRALDNVNTPGDMEKAQRELGGS